jgi:RimJ/RimL family protein N-acetyltransferase
MEREETSAGEGQVVDQQRGRMLRLVTKGFFNELVNYGVKREEMVHVATHLLDNVLNRREEETAASPLGGIGLSLRSVQDRWRTEQRLSVDQVTLRRLERAVLPQLSEWLRAPGVSDSFFPPFPSDEEALGRHFFGSTGSDYLAIEVDGQPVGFVGGESLDIASGRMEMRKLVGVPERRGQGIGKRATFGFLYYAFCLIGLHKVYIHSRDINVRNMNLNSSFGFEIEGVFFEEVPTSDGRRADIVRMALLKPIWLALFGT